MTIGNGTLVQLENNGGVPTNIQDQTTSPLMIYFNKEIATTTLALDVAVGASSFTVANPAGFAVGNIASLFNQSGGYFSYGRIIDVTGSVITIDTPVDLPYLAGMLVSTNLIGLNVNGSVTPQVFTLRGSDPGLGIVGDITRIHFQMTTTAAADFGMFGDIAGGLDKGCVLRKNLGGGFYQNLFNFRNNSDIAILSGETYEPLDATKHGVFGLTSELRFGGQGNVGVVIRVETFEDLEFVVQDDLTTLIEFRVMNIGHVLQN